LPEVQQEDEVPGAPDVFLMFVASASKRPLMMLSEDKDLLIFRDSVAL